MLANANLTSIVDCIESLEVAEMDNDRIESRLSTIVERHGKTLDWLFQDPVFRSDGRERRHGFLPWIQGEEGIFWIRGIPASGKSTAMKYIHDRMQDVHRQNQSWMHVALFFHDRGTSEQKTMLGMLRALLKQLILGCPRLEESETAELVRLVAPFGRVSSSGYQTPLTKRRGMENWLWTMEGLQKAIRAVATQNNIRRNVFLMIDALDEHSGDDEGMIRFFQDLAAPNETRTFKFQILLASRPDPPFDDLLRTYPHLNIQEWTKEDIKAFVTSSFELDTTFQARLQHFQDREDVPKLEAAVVHRARGVFLWVRLVIEDVLDQVKRRRTADVSTLSTRLAELPDGLVDLYTHILMRVPASESIETYILLETVLRAKRPLTVLELACVLTLGLDKVSRKLSEQESLKSRMNQGSINAIEKGAWDFVDRILGSCKGLLAVQGRNSERQWPDEGESASTAESEVYIIPYHRIEKSGRLSEEESSGSQRTKSSKLRGAGDDSMFFEQRDPLIHQGTLVHAQGRVQLLHQSVKEYLLEKDGRNLDYLFERADLSDATINYADCRVRPADNGHIYILDLCVQLLHISTSPTCNHRSVGPRDEVTEPTSVLPLKVIAQSVLHHGPNADATMGISCMLTLEAIDRCLQIALRRENWPAYYHYSQHTHNDWNFNFLAYAVVANMYHFVQDKLSQRPDLLDERKGHPLLIVALSPPSIFNVREPATCAEPGMVQLLLEHRTKGQDQWVDGAGNKQNALTSAVYTQRLLQACAYGYPIKEIMLLLLSHGVDPNIAVPISTRLIRNQQQSRPIAHYVMGMRIGVDDKMEILRGLKKARADFAAKDTYGLGMLDVYCESLLHGYFREELSITELEWIIKAGARITAGMFNSDGFKRSLLYHNALRHPEYYTRDGRKAARKDNPQWPQPSLPERLFNM